MERLDKIYNTYEKIKIVFMRIGTIALFGMMFYITLDVLIRNLAPQALVGTYEVVSYYVMPLIILPSMCYALSSGVMPRIVVVVSRMPRRMQQIMGIILPVLDLTLCLMMFIFSTRYAITATHDKLSFIAGTASLPVWQMYYFAGMAYLMMCLENIFVLIRNFMTGNVNILYRS